MDRALPADDGAAAIGRERAAAEADEDTRASRRGLVMRGQITVPENGSAVPDHFDAAGEVFGFPSGHRLWLAVEVSGLLFFKEPEVVIDQGSWRSEISGTATAHSFQLALYDVGPDGQRTIENWLREGRTTGSYPGLQRIQGDRQLDRVVLHAG